MHMHSFCAQAFEIPTDNIAAMVKALSAFFERKQQTTTPDVKQELGTMTAIGFTCQPHFQGE